MNSQLWRTAGSVVVVSAGLILAPASWAQKAALDDGAASGSVSASESTAKPAKAAPAAQAAQPGQKAAKPSSDVHIKPGSDFPRVETAPTFMYIHTSPVLGGTQGFNCAGGGGTLAYNFTSVFGLAADMGGCKLATREVPCAGRARYRRMSFWRRAPRSCRRRSQRTG